MHAIGGFPPVGQSFRRESAMEILIWIGAGLTVLGLCGLIWCILRALAARRAGLSDDAMRIALHRVVVLNMGALAVSALGLVMVVAGVVLA